MAGRDSWAEAVRLIRPQLLLAPPRFLRDLRHGLARGGVAAAVRAHDDAALFGWLLRTAQMQGIGDRAAVAYADRHGLPSLREVEPGLRASPCPRLRSHWDFADCRFRKAAATCARPDLIDGCIVPRLPARKGSLAQLAVGLALFLRDVCTGDLVGWIDERLAAADSGPGSAGRGAAMVAALVEPLSQVQGLGPKVASMAMADLLLGADPDRERWVVAGASMIAVDSLVHAHLRRLGVLRLLDAEHPYGPRCYAPGGCAGVIAGLAERIDAREFAPENPAYFPRLVQFAAWFFCSEAGWSICNGRRIDAEVGCRQTCPADRGCARRPDANY